jgi:antitoxin MazE
MEVSVIKIGNSKGIRIPKTVLQQLGIDEKVEMEVHNQEILIKPLKKHPREGWDEKFIEMHQNGDDAFLIDENLDKDAFAWEW